jgi:hypothetical protein
MGIFANFAVFVKRENEKIMRKFNKSHRGTGAQGKEGRI